MNHSDRVRIIVDSSGTVRDVLIPHDWRDSLLPGELGPALCTAANAALAELDRPDHEPEPAGDTLRAGAPDAGGDPTDPVAQHLVTEVLDLLSRFDRDLATYTERLDEQASYAATGTGPQNGIIVVITAGVVGGVVVDSAWAATASPARLRDEALSAFEAAQQEAADTTAVRAPASIARLRELAADPRALSRQLGLAR